MLKYLSCPRKNIDKHIYIPRHIEYHGHTLILLSQGR